MDLTAGPCTMIVSYLLCINSKLSLTVVKYGAVAFYANLKYCTVENTNKVRLYMQSLKKNVKKKFGNTFIPMRKLVLNYVRSSGVHFSYKMEPHCTLYLL